MQKIVSNLKLAQQAMVDYDYMDELKNPFRFNMASKRVQFFLGILSRDA